MDFSPGDKVTFRIGKHRIPGTFLRIEQPGYTGGKGRSYPDMYRLRTDATGTEVVRSAASVERA